jgi:hypothetical protein
MTSFNSKHNKVVGRCLVLLYDCQQSGIFPHGLTLTQIQRGAAVNNDYLMNKVTKWREWDYVVGKPIVMNYGRARWHYRIGAQGIRFVESLPDEVIYYIRHELSASVGNIPDVPPRIEVLK